MTNGNMKTIHTRRAIEWDNFLERIINQIEENGYYKKLWKPQIERLILRHAKIMQIEEDIIKGFKGIKKVNMEVETWIKG